jgi:hypothetical protein
MLLVDLFFPVIFGVTLGLVLGRSPRSLASLQPTHVWLLWLAAAVQIAEYYVPPLKRLALSGARPWFTVAIFGCVAACLWLNATRYRGALQAAWLTIGVGAVMNTIPIALNGTMPFSRSAALAAGVPALNLDSVHVKNGVAHAGTKLAWLGDVIPVAPIAKVFSIGDCAIVFGTALLIFSGMQRPERKPFGPDAEPCGMSRPAHSV